MSDLTLTIANLQKCYLYSVCVCHPPDNICYVLQGVDLSRLGFTFVPIIPSVDAPSISAPNSTTIRETESGAGFRVLAIQPIQASSARSSHSHVGLLQSRVLPSVFHAVANGQGQGTLLVVDDLSVVEGLYGTTEALTLLRTCKALMAKDRDKVRHAWDLLSG